MCVATQDGGERKITVSEVLRRFAPAYLQHYGDVMSFDQRRALSAILQCRTEALGGRVLDCEACGLQRYVGYSCGHHACPLCGRGETQAWVATQLDRLINVPYFMVTFTLPAELRPLMRRHAEVLYDGFFEVTSRCLKETLGMRISLGTAGTGFLGIMHTWTQLLRYHPHIHYIVPGVGLCENGTARQVKSAKFLVPLPPLKDDFKASVKALLTKHDLLGACDTKVWDKDWRINIRPFGNGQNAVKYLGAYVRKTVIGDSRILWANETHVHFSYKDRADGGAIKQDTVTGVEFVSRYLQHVFPPKFHRLRYYGFLQSRGRDRLLRLQTLTETPIVLGGDGTPVSDTPKDACSGCGKSMEEVDTFQPRRWAIPLVDRVWEPLHPKQTGPLRYRRKGRDPPTKNLYDHVS